MQRSVFPILIVGVFASPIASAQPVSFASPGQVFPQQAMPATPPMVVMVPAQPAVRGNLGGGFIEFLFGERGPQPQVMPPPGSYPNAMPAPRPIYANTEPTADPVPETQRPSIDPQF